MFGRKKTEPRDEIISVETYKVLDHSIVWGLGDYSSVVVVADKGEGLRHIELVNCKIDKNVVDFANVYVEVTTYDDETYATRLFKK